MDCLNKASDVFQSSCGHVYLLLTWYQTTVQCFVGSGLFSLLCEKPGIARSRFCIIVSPVVCCNFDGRS